MGQKTKLNSAEREKLGSGLDRFIESLRAVDFNNRNEEAEYK